MSDTTQFRVMDFDCPTCAGTVERALSNVDGVQHVEVHYATGRVEVEHDDSIADSDTLAQTIENQGYTPQPA
ncbi:heavy-metal-associated domain-containing protein [Halobacterium rubrum]|uniref:heavy-metal-associated domain-containing protein n=1 Tax=Halobacterium TaxID=2239 RepID=UPI001F3D3C7B|nr:MULTISPECIES: heavy-metal-associated domain-containing protein [Halobacterium]MDH5021206.1 heavy-metal-associated domain-containing protein [Halobacterium rubrum]